MTTLSAFQTLPLHIAEAISRYCIDTHRIVHTQYSSPENRIANAMEIFYKVSNVWRILALRYFCKDLSLGLCNTVTFRLLPPSIKIQKYFYNFVKSLMLIRKQSLTPVYPQMAKRYSEAWPKDITLTSASSLTIFIATDSPNTDNHEENEQIFRILQQIRAAMPKLREVVIGKPFGANYWLGHSANTMEQKLDSLFVDILKSASKLDVDKWQNLLDGRDPLFLNGSRITSLRYVARRDDMEYFSIVLQRLGPTLESLEIPGFPLESIKALVFNSDGSPIVYSQLKRLRFFGEYLQQHAKPPLVDLSVAPFPNLRYLMWRSDYPFKDDVLLRGSRDTLEYLHIKFNRTGLNVFEKYDMASMSRRYTRLLHLSAVKHPDPDPEYKYEDCDRLLKLGASLITPATRTFATDGHCSWHQVFRTLSACPYTENIQVLSLEFTKLRLSDMLDLIELFPNMTDFTCCFDGCTTHKSEWKNRDALDRRYSEYYPLSHRLKCWKVAGTMPQAKQVATAAITLAVLCPNFTFVAVPLNEINVYIAKVEKAVDSGEYHDHRDKIERLISNQWR